jgi:hypothetical protein
MRNVLLVSALVLGLIVSPGAALGQSPAPAGCATAIEPVNKALAETAGSATELVGKISAIDTRIDTYYQQVATPAGQTVPNYPELRAAVTKAKQTAETEIGQLSALQLRCNPSPAASVARLNKEVTEALAAVRAYRTAVRTELLVLRTKAIQASSPKPAADDRTEP